MRRPIKLSPSHRELQVMSVLWRHEDASVATVQAELNAHWEPDVAYTTVLTYLRSLIAKGWVSAETSERAYRYVPVVSRHHARAWAVTELLDLYYDGSREALLRDLRTRRFPFGPARSAAE